MEGGPAKLGLLALTWASSSSLRLVFSFPGGNLRKKEKEKKKKKKEKRTGDGIEKEEI